MATGRCLYSRAILVVLAPAMAANAATNSTARRPCACRKPRELTTMPMAGANMYNYTNKGKTHQLPDTWGSRCHSWEADDTSKGFVGDWGCTKELLAKPKHWCNDIWCYVDGCDCRDEFAIETLMWTGTKGLYFTYDFCCKQMKSKTDCTAKGSKCVWNAPNSKCFMSGSADTYIENRCNTKASNWMDCAKWTSCTWKGNLNKCSAATASTRAKALSCPDAGGDKTVSGAARSCLMATAALAAATVCLTSI